LGGYFVYRFSCEKKFNWPNLIGFLICGLLASLIHGLGLVLLAVGGSYLVLTSLSRLRKRPATLLFLTPLVMGVFFIPHILDKLSFLGKVNNLFYYRVFLTHQYPFLVLFFLIGFLALLARKKKAWLLPIIFIGAQTFIVAFLLWQPFTRYYYLIFPFFVLIAAVGLVETSGRFFKQKNWPLLLLVVLFLIASGSKFAWIPQGTYSLNQDMQEIPEVDWKKTYQFIEKKMVQDKETVLVTTWNDHAVWYLGEGHPDYLLRSPTGYQDEVDALSGAPYLRNLDSFLKVYGGHEAGLILIDSWDDRIPEEVRRFIGANLKKELEVDRIYPVQPRYWPVEIYSWGLD
jgi:hypothetical protein